MVQQRVIINGNHQWSNTSAGVPHGFGCSFYSKFTRFSVYIKKDFNGVPNIKLGYVIHE